MPFVTKGGQHIHHGSGMELKKVTQVHQAYKGETGDKSFLVRICECGKLMPFDYGPTTQMREVLKELKYRKEHGV